MFKKIFLLAGALILAATAFTATANAGGCGKRGFSGASYSHSAKARKLRRARIAQQRRLAKRRAAQRRAIAQKKALKAKKAKIAAAKAKKAQVAAAEAAKQKAEEAKTASNTETTTPEKPMSVAALAGADIEPATEPVTSNKNGTDAEEETSSNQEVGCKKYIPAAGLTITVPCTL